MPRSGSGQYTPTSGSWTNPVNGQLATSGDWTALLNDISAALTQSLSADGQTPVTGNLNLGNNKITSLSAGTGSGNALEFSQLFNQGTEQDLASAATTDIGAQLTNFLRITGTTTITSFGTNYKGPRFLRFEGAVTLTNGSALTLPGGANITTAAGDCLIAIPRATLGTADGWVVVAYQKNAVPGTPDGSITTAKLADSSVTSAKIAAGAVTSDKLSSTAQYMGFKNRIINAQGLINQRGYVSGTATTTANQYTVDRWRVVTSGQNLTFSTSNNEVTFTAPAGGVEQVIEGLNLESGTYTLSWTGTATATVGGTSVTNGGQVTVVGGTNTTVRFIGGTFKYPQFEKGSTATSFDYRPYGTELALCQRYYQVYGPYTLEAYANSATVRALTQIVTLPVTMRTTPTKTIISNGTSVNMRSPATSYAGLAIIGTQGSTYVSASMESAAAGLTTLNDRTEALSAEL